MKTEFTITAERFEKLEKAILADLKGEEFTTDKFGVYNMDTYNLDYANTHVSRLISTLNGSITYNVLRWGNLRRFSISKSYDYVGEPRYLFTVERF